MVLSICSPASRRTVVRIAGRLFRSIRSFVRRRTRRRGGDETDEDDGDDDDRFAGDDADEDANTLILERCIAAPGHAAALRILERTIQEASPRVLGDRFPRASASIEAGLASPSSAVAACRAALALTGEVESEPARQHVAKRLVPAVAAILTAAALAGGDGPAAEILTSAALLFDEPLVSWTSFLPAKARALFEVPGAAEALADACGQCVSSETIGDDVRSTALEVLAALLEAAAYWLSLIHI